MHSKSTCPCPWIPSPHPPFEDVPAGEASSRGWVLTASVHYFDPAAPGRLVIVSRKEDRTRFCVPGGKVDPEDWGGADPSPARAEAACLAAAVRESREEAGLLIEPGDLLRILGTPCFGDGPRPRFTVQYLARRAVATMRTDEPIDVRWGAREDVLSGPFGSVYELVYRALATPRWRGLEAVT